MIAAYVTHSRPQAKFVTISRPVFTDLSAVGQLVSTAGGIHPVWRPDGKELYYLNPAGEMMAAPITITGSTLVPGAPVKLFPTRTIGGGMDAAQRRQYDVALDGRFLGDQAELFGEVPN